MTNKKELNLEQLDKVSGGGSHIYYGEMKDVPDGAFIVYEDMCDGRKEHKVILVRKDLANDSVYVRPADTESEEFFNKWQYRPVELGIDNGCGDDYYAGSRDIHAVGDGTYRIHYTRMSTTYFHWL